MKMRPCKDCPAYHSTARSSEGPFMGTCRAHTPTAQGWPMVAPDGWCIEGQGIVDNRPMEVWMADHVEDR